VAVPTARGGANVSFYAVSARTADEAWAVGSRYTGSRDVTVAERWDGARWRSVPTPNPASNGSYLTDVAALSASDAWAVGYSTSGAGQAPLIERWDGSAWHVVPAPDVGSSVAYLASVAGTDGSDAWAVGYSLSEAGYYRTLVLRWGGSAWHVVPSPDVSGYANALDAVAIRSATDAWAVGYAVTDAAGSTRTLVLHWDGTAWAVSASIDPSVTANALTGVTVAGTGDAWAVGAYNDGTDNLTLIERWDGTAWTQIPGQNVAASGNVLNDVTGASPSDLWAVGYWYRTAPRGPFEALAERWDETAWRIVPTPGNAGLQAGDLAEYLQGASSAGGRVWAAGSATGTAVMLASCDPSG
jgi:hypothetical protein